MIWVQSFGLQIISELINCKQLIGLMIKSLSVMTGNHVKGRPPISTEDIKTWTAQELTRRGRDASKWQLFATSAEKDVFLFRNATKNEQITVYQHADGQRVMGHVWGS